MSVGGKMVNPLDDLSREGGSIPTPTLHNGARIAYPLFQEGDGGSCPTSPLQLNIYEISVERAVELNKQWHSRLPVIGISNIIRNKDYICFGAEFEGKLYASAIWSSPVAANRLKNGKYLLELRRMAISAESPKNTASRMISIMVRAIRKSKPHIVKLISYQDTDVHSGTIYKASGWCIGNSSTLVDWTNRKRNMTIATGPKLRWEKEMR
jgi:hypothetical protein